MSIQRFEPSSGVSWPVDCGDYVKYADHVNEIEKLEKQVEFEMGQKVKAREQRNDYVKEFEKCLSEYQARIEELDGDNKFIQSQYKMTIEKNDKLQEQVDAFENVKEAFCDFLNKK
tara:strand:- start:2064 stop:2411 length:348 start_codon:yes stop_codon:yes gene_type:complete